MPAVRLGIDMDGVIADFTGGWVRLYNREFRTDVRPEAVRSWGAIPDLTHFASMGEFWDWSTDLDGVSIFAHLEPFPGAIEALHRLARRHHIAIITTKPAFAVADTFRWLADHGVPTTEVHITEAKEVVDCDAYLDDGPHVLEALAAHRPEALVCRYVRPWNAPLPGVVDVADWPAFEAVVEDAAS